LTQETPAITWIFFGRVLPERTPLKFIFPSSRIQVPDFGLTLELSDFIVDNSQFLLRVRIERGSCDLLTMRNIIDDHIRAHLDFIGYKRGVVYHLDIVGSFVPDFSDYHFFAQLIPALAELKSNTVSGTGQFDIRLDEIELVSGSVAIKLALADLRKAKDNAVDSGFYCYRAVESIRQEFGEVAGAAWEHLRRSLKVDRSCIDYLKHWADPRRHGKSVPIIDGERKNLLIISDEIVDRYIKYKMNNGVYDGEELFMKLNDAAP
jgi:hypothetical protein